MVRIIKAINHLMLGKYIKKLVLMDNSKDICVRNRTWNVALSNIKNSNQNACKYYK